MKKLFKISLIIAFLLQSYGIFAQNVPIIRYKDLEKMMSKNNDTTYVFNFWATWCKPCMAELKHFDTLTTNLRQKKVKVILVNLDFAKEVENVYATILKRKIGSTVVLLNEPDYDSWINKISTEWSGAVPATLILNNDKKKRLFYEQPFDYQALASEVNKVLR